LQVAIDMSTQNALRPLTDSTAHAVLQVVEGIHEGVSMPLAKSVYSIGSRPTADIVLGDSGVAPEHGIVRLHGSAVVVEAAGGEIGLGKHDRIPHGHGRRATLPVELKLGTAVLKIARNRSGERAWPSSRIVGRFAAIAGIGMVVLLPLSGFYTDTAIGRLSFAVLPTTDASQIPVQGRPDVSTGPATTASAGAPVARVDAATVADALTLKLKDAGLAELLTKMEGVRVVVSGVISHEQTSSWAEIQRWFDLTYGGRFILASAVEARAPSGPPRFDLQAISFSDTPYVITADGQRRYPGAILDKGWVIKDIAAGRLTLTKDGTELALSF
jgi:hypothetical protein